MGSLRATTGGKMIHETLLSQGLGVLLISVGIAIIIYAVTYLYEAVSKSNKEEK
jgi:hypothetical protein